MTTIRAYTTIEQSRKLAEILPLESADMFYSAGNETQPTFRLHSYGHIMSNEDVCAWSLSALLDILPEEYTNLIIKEGGMYRTLIKNFCMTPWFDNPIDACVAMIEKLHELKML